MEHNSSVPGPPRPLELGRRCGFVNTSTAVISFSVRTRYIWRNTDDSDLQKEVQEPRNVMDAPLHRATKRISE